MLRTVRYWLTRPLAEDFSFRNQARLSLLSGLYIFLFTFLLAGSALAGWKRIGLIASVAAGCVLTSLIANWLVSSLLPTAYNEERWSVGRHALHVLFVLFCVSLGNQLVIALWGLAVPSLWSMYLTVMLIGFFPIMLCVFVAERRRLKRNLANAETVNQQLNQLHTVAEEPAEAVWPESISLVSENGKEQLSLLPNQLIYIESVGNYIEVHWLNFMFPQKTVLRSTLKEAERVLQHQPQFFRCHRAFLINLKAVNQTEGNARGYQLLMSGSNREIPVSRTYIDAFNARMKQLV